MPDDGSLTMAGLYVANQAVLLGTHGCNEGPHVSVAMCESDATVWQCRLAYLDAWVEHQSVTILQEVWSDWGGTGCDCKSLYMLVVHCGCRSAGCGAECVT